MIRAVVKFILLGLLIVLCTGCQEAPQSQPPTPLVTRSFPPSFIHLPEESVVRELGDDSGVDFGNASRGYILAWYTGSGHAKVQIILLDNNDSEIVWNYDIDEPGVNEVLPLQGGSGRYRIFVAEQIEGDRFSPLLMVEFDVELENELLPFLYPTKYSRFALGSEALKKAHELTGNAQSDIEALVKVYEFIRDNIAYDVHKAETIVDFYTPSPDEVLMSGMGICFDFASLFSAMLRANGIPARLVIGEVGDGLSHAWNSVFLENEGWVDFVVHFAAGEWRLVDTTFAAVATSQRDLEEMIGNGESYVEMRIY